MKIHQSSVNFRNLIKDLADMYTYPVPEVILTELIANSLDAKATKIDIRYDHSKKTLIVEDNGEGMSKSQFEEYHDFAAGLKSRGSGIGFAGLGAKVSFNIATRVMTESISSSFQGGSNWYLKSQKELVWEEIDKLPNLDHKGTRIEVWFSKETPLINYIDQFFSTRNLSNLIMKHYLPLLDRTFLLIYSKMGYYSENLQFSVNNEVINKFDIAQILSMEKTKRFFLESKGRRYGWGIFGLSPVEYPLGTDAVGIALSVFGKVIKYDFLGQFPAEMGPQIFGIVEIPSLIKFLNTSKTDFIRGRTNAKKYYELYEPLRLNFKKWLKESGIGTLETKNQEDAVKLEQEINKLAREIPEIHQFFYGKSVIEEISVKNLKGDLNTSPAGGIEITFPLGKGEDKAQEGIVSKGDKNGDTLRQNTNGQEKASRLSRRRQAGIRVSFIEKPESQMLGWLEGNTVLINKGHNCYKKLESHNLARKVYNLFSIAIIIERELEKQEILSKEVNLTDKIMSAWGKT